LVSVVSLVLLFAHVPLSFQLVFVCALALSRGSLVSQRAPALV